MNNKLSIAIIIFFSLLICQNRINAQPPTSSGDIYDMKDLVKKEDFENLSKLLKSNGFTISKWNLNYSHSSYYVIAEIECEKELTPLISKQNAFLNTKNTEQLTISFYEYDDSKKLTISDSYISFGNNFPLFYYVWKYQNWTYVKFGDLNNGFQLGEIGSMGIYGNSLKKVYTDSINLEFVHTGDYGIKPLVPKYKSMQFINYNENFGVLRNYICELNAPWPKSDFFLPGGGDTAYSLYLHMDEYYPKFARKTDNPSIGKTKTIQLIKSGKIYFINISIGAKKKKYVLDSGASDFTIDESSYKQLLESGTIKIEHKLTDGDYRIADGSIKTYKRTIIPEIIIGNIKVENITATIVPDGQPLLLGKSVLDNFKTWKIDNTKNILVIETD